MRKILLASNAHEVKTPAVDFACYIANLTKSPVAGVFLDNEYKNKRQGVLVKVGDEEFQPSAPESIAENADIFCNRCMYNDARHSIYYIQGNPVQEITKESLYADVILTDGNTCFNECDGWPSQFVKDLLEHAKCPVIITPFDFDEINEIVFAYDGTESSTFAIKQFIYLFPELHDIKITVLQVLHSEDAGITEKEKLQQLLSMHYNAVHYELLHGDADIELFKKFLSERNKMLVMGAYGRKNFLNRSTADILLKTLNIPIFITHY